MDLLTVLAHELGHVIGREHSDGLHDDVMSSTLGAGLRALPGVEGSGIRSQVLGVSGRRSAISDQLFSGSGLSALDSPVSSGIQHPVSSIQTSAFRTPTSAFEIDSLFARLDDERAGGLAEDDENGTRDRDQESDESEDGLDLWTILHGLDS
jgi:hypothetical protein